MIPHVHMSDSKLVSLQLNLFYWPPVLLIVNQVNTTMCIIFTNKSWYLRKKKETFNLTMHSTHFLVTVICGVRHMVKDHSNSKRGSLLLPHGLFFLISSKGCFICTIPVTG